jgi:hypothetical protein
MSTDLCVSKHSIASKLEQEFNQSIKTERQVVYILAQIRKLMELEKSQNRYVALNFHCNWALHPELSISAEGRRIVEIFDRAEAFLIQMENTVPGQPMANPDSSWMEPLENVVELSHLKSEFQQFCHDHGISGKLVTSETEWLNFIDKYAFVIEEVPLVSSDANLQHVKKVITRRIPIPSGMNAAEVGKRYYLAIQWEWMSPNGVQKVRQSIFSHTITPQSRMHYRWMQTQLFFAKLRYHVVHAVSNKGLHSSAV